MRTVLMQVPQNKSFLYRRINIMLLVIDVVLVIRINLKEENLQPGNSKYVKIRSRLQTLGNFNVIILWEPPTDEVCPSSIAKYFFDLDYKVKCCTPHFDSNVLYSIKVPDIDFKNFEEIDTIDFIEWLGMISISGELDDDQKYVSSFETPLPNREIGQVKHLQWKGLFSTNKINEFIEGLREYNKLANKPWIAVYVQGFSDSPVAWDAEEHHYYTNGDNGYLLVFNKENCLFYSQKCSKKCYK